MRSRERGLAAATVAIVLSAVCAGIALGASPTPSPQLGDPRSGGQGPGLVGDPLLALMIVVGLGLLSLAATLLYVRATGGSRRTGS